jgi:hypothetical protein
MKHILNNLTEQEKNAIREQHTGGMKVSTDKFNHLLESKLGDVKPILSEQKSNLGMKSIDKDKNTFKEVVKFLKLKGLNGFKFKESIEGDESLGIILELPQDRTSTMWVLPDGEYLIAKKGKVFEEGKWNWDGMKLTLVAQPGAAKNTHTSVNEQNRRLMVRRHIKMTNTEGKTLLFDVTTVESNNEGCLFDGDFRGNYDSIKNFLGLGTDGKGHSFKFDCSAPATIMLNDVDDMTYLSQPDGSPAKFIGKAVKYTLDTEGQKVLSNLCKCSRYK